MRISEISIDRFAAWRNLQLPLPGDGLNVLYGPNETGKSTLMRFVRAILYGYSPDDETGTGARPKRAACSGSLEVWEGTDRYVLRRESKLGSRGRLSVTCNEGVVNPDEAVGRLLGGVSADVYEHIFAVGLTEMQELATLEGDEVAERIYEMSLGRDGERIVAAWEKAENARRDLLDPDQETGRVVELSRQIEELDRKIQAAGASQTDHAELQAQTQQLYAAIADQKKRQAGLQEQLRGHLFMEQVFGPWERQRKLRRERDGLASIPAFPEDGVERLEQIERDIAEASREKARLKQEAARFAEGGERTAARDAVRQHAPRVRLLIEQAHSVQSAAGSLGQERERIKSLRGEVDARIRQLGEGWSLERLQSFDDSSQATSRLFLQADRYLTALRRRSRYVKRYQRKAAHAQKVQADFAAETEWLDGEDAAVVRNLLAATVDDLRTARELKSRMELEEMRAEAVREQIAAAREPHELPRHFYTVLWVFGLSGLGLLTLGLVRAFQSEAGSAPWIIGVIFGLLGLCCAGVTWTIKEHFDPQRRRESGLKERLKAATRARDEAHSELAAVCAGVAADCPESIRELSPHRDDSLEDLDRSLDTARQRLAELTQLARRERMLLSRRERLSVMRGRVRDLQRSVSEGRRDWCLLLKQIGLDESVGVRTALETWQTVHQAREVFSRWQAAQQELARKEAEVREFQEKVSRLGAEIDGREVAQGDALKKLDEWKRRLDAADAAREERRELARRSRAIRAERRKIAASLSRLRVDRLALLAQVGASDRDEFLSRHKAHQRRLELDDLLIAAGEEVEAAAAAEPELAVVEEDLLRFDQAENREAIETIRNELGDLEAELQLGHEELGRLRGELRALENSREEATLRFDRAQLAAELDEATQRLCAVELTLDGLDAIRARLEQGLQPETLTRAAHYLKRLTLGKYQRVWTPVGERRLVVDDEQRESLRVEQLSNGAREQLFLAIRLALIEQFEEQGAVLPVVLDDVVVNFDQQRTEAAVETLMDFAARGRQVLMFTCHRHLAQLFESAGAAPIRLPEPALAVERRQVG
ncbi:MAG: hypothetical protein DWQ29_20890 [Planctomycetota bacterium]|nr:MAG: hypothetical protein DWQ29_20890 [Planctomycetota bacterium]